MKRKLKIKIYQLIANAIIFLCEYSLTDEQFLIYSGFGTWLDLCAIDEDIYLD